jgi:hypothetical protein
MTRAGKMRFSLIELRTWRSWHKHLLPDGVRGPIAFEGTEAAHVEVGCAVLRDSASNCALPCSSLLRVVWWSWNRYLWPVPLNRKVNGRQRRDEA